MSMVSSLLGATRTVWLWSDRGELYWNRPIGGGAKFPASMGVRTIPCDNKDGATLGLPFSIPLAASRNGAFDRQTHVSAGGSADLPALWPVPEPVP